MSEPMEVAEFWAAPCSDCAHDRHDMDVCSAIVGGGMPSDGPTYCPCAIDYPALAAEYQRKSANCAEALRSLVTNVEYLCEEHGTNSILIADLRAVAEHEIAEARRPSRVPAWLTRLRRTLGIVR